KLAREASRSSCSTRTAIRSSYSNLPGNSTSVNAAFHEEGQSGQHKAAASRRTPRLARRLHRTRTAAFTRVRPLPGNRGNISPSRKGSVMGHRRGLGRIFFVLAAFGVFSTIGMLGRPTLASVRPVDVVHLIGTGMCF